MKTTSKFYNSINALTALGTNVTMFKDFRRLKFLFPCPKLDKSQLPFLAFKVFFTAEFLRFYGPRRERKDLFHDRKRIFLAGQPMEITSGKDVAILPAREFSHVTESLIKIESGVN